MDEKLFAAVDRYIDGRFAPEDAALIATRDSIASHAGKLITIEADHIHATQCRPRRKSTGCLLR